MITLRTSTHSLSIDPNHLRHVYDRFAPSARGIVLAVTLPVNQER
jgi:hypothetical protein